MQEKIREVEAESDSIKLKQRACNTERVNLDQNLEKFSQGKIDDDRRNIVLRNLAKSLILKRKSFIQTERN